MSEAGVQALIVSGVHKRFGNVEALRGVDLAVEQGEIFGFLGPNGAGKTTTIRVLTGFIRADQGAARVLGMEAWGETVAIKARLGFLPDVVAFASGFTGQDFLELRREPEGHQGQTPSPGGAAGAPGAPGLCTPAEGERVLLGHGRRSWRSCRRCSTTPTC